MISTKRRVFNQEEAEALLPLINLLTAKSRRKIADLNNQLFSLSHVGSEKRESVEREIDEQIDLWMSKVRALGGHPKGPWNADFDNGMGYFCWRYPETQILFSHDYHEGFLGRKLLKKEAMSENSNSTNQPDPREF